MNVKQKIAALAVVILGAGMLTAEGAYAACVPSTAVGCSTVTANLALLSGTRVLTSVTPAVALNGVNGSVMTGTVTAVITEATASGVSPWSVKAKLDGGQLSDVSGTVIAGSNLTLSPQSVTNAPSGTGTLALGTALTLDSERLIFSNTGQTVGAPYTSVYTANSTISLTVPNGTPNSVYTGTLIVTLYQ